jgi:hypothetical protein
MNNGSFAMLGPMRRGHAVMLLKIMNPASPAARVLEESW